MSNEEATGFAGRVEHLELQHIIQIACLAGICATIVVWRGNQKGYLRICHFAMSREVSPRAD
jgi:hypothetical protein